jgi:uncharacterized OB-fold protein
MQCPKCGTTVQVGDRFCEECGTPLIEESAIAKATGGCEKCLVEFARRSSGHENITVAVVSL